MSDSPAAGPSRAAETRVLTDRSAAPVDTGPSSGVDALDSVLSRIAAVLLCLATVEHETLEHGFGAADGIEELVALADALERDVATLLDPDGASSPVGPLQLEMVRAHLAAAGAGVHRVLALAEDAAA
jgi:hypothetical protein